MLNEVSESEAPWDAFPEYSSSARAAHLLRCHWFAYITIHMYSDIASTASKKCAKKKCKVQSKRQHGCCAVVVVQTVLYPILDTCIVTSILHILRNRNPSRCAFQPTHTHTHIASELSPPRWEPTCICTLPACNYILVDRALEVCSMKLLAAVVPV
jgi:hypothetical protein